MKAGLAPSRRRKRATGNSRPNQAKRRASVLRDNLTKAEETFLRRELIQRNGRYAAVRAAFAARFGRLVSVSSLQRWFAGESKPKAATHEEITVHLEVRLLVPKGCGIRLVQPEVKES